MQDQEIPPTSDEEREAAGVIRRIKRISGGAFVVFAVVLLISSGARALIGLTCSAAVTMISFLWLEEIVDALLQPVPHPHATRRLTLRTLARFTLLGVALWVTIIVARFNALSVLLGFSIVVVGIMGEAAYATYKSFAD
jgi:hypothetical protein